MAEELYKAVVGYFVDDEEDDTEELGEFGTYEEAEAAIEGHKTAHGRPDPGCGFRYHIEQNSEVISRSTEFIEGPDA